ncbi:MAG TPA: hypothetical protein VFS28_03085 [Gemmatimonadales bacterium]|nr:hypothetical protein [Gemmatimonadales bacterium]
MRRAPLLLLVLAACGGPPPKSLPTITIAAAADSLNVPDLDVSQARWLGGERWALLSQLGNVVRVVDWSKHTVTPLGRPGKDYQHPSVIFTAGDTLYLNDWGMRRTTAWTPAGKLAGAWPAPALTGGVLPSARDGAGRFYAEQRPLVKMDGTGRLDSAVVVRWIPGATQLDTVARLAPYTYQQVNDADGQRYVRPIFSGADLWGVRPSGELWIARVGPNRVEVRDTAGTWHRGPRLPDALYPVTRQDRDYYADGFPEDQRSIAEQLPFAIVKAPFEAAWVAGDGRIWLEKSRSLTDTLRSYQVLGAGGAVDTVVQVKNARRILGSAANVLLGDEQLPGTAGFRILRFWTGAPR